ncbi:uncharacterized protein LOC111376108 [Olea europaea var. sylvestris]|uniref:uncharacterized protein LOC111376108 n=1 Tax=Olea europaea var. sylvestris TaxID=158386 RepID=UPI000C1D8048|nr:uncharacterized protein LOC111376108 [Olea europaea var. sylvestris]
MSLSKNTPESMHDLLKKGDKYVDAEKAEKVTKNLRDGWETEAHKRKTNDERRHADKNKPKNEHMNKGYTHDRPIKQKGEEVQVPTPLNIPRTKLLMEIQYMKELKWPKSMLTPSSKRNQSKYFHFHKDHGHDIEECLQLNEEIERLLRRGLLAKYVKNDRGKQRLEDLSPARVGVINMIIGGVALGSDSNFARKSYARFVGVCSIQKKVRFNQSITFDEEDLIDITHPHDDALVIVGDMADFNVKRVLVDGESAANVLTWDAFLGLKIFPEKLKMVTTPLQGFGEAIVISKGTVELPVTQGTYLATVVIVTNFLVIKTPIAYNAIYGWPLLNAAGAVPSTYHQVMKFPTSRGVGCVRGDQHESRKCYVDSIQAKGSPPIMVLDVELPRGRIEPLHMTEKIFIAEGRGFSVGTGLEFEEKEKLTKCLASNLDVFTWGLEDIPGISPIIAQHHLGVQLGAKPMKQKKEILPLRGKPQPKQR